MDYSKFFDIKASRQQKIITAALLEFAKEGYSNASTNKIVTGADISKGILFHYFKSKDGLFNFLLGYCNVILMDDYYQKIDLSAGYIEFMRSALTLRRVIRTQNPGVFEFIERVMQDGGSVANEMLSDIKLQGFGFASLLSKVNERRFKSGIDVEALSEISQWAIDGIVREQRQLLLQGEQLEQLEEYYLYQLSIMVLR